MQEDIGNAYYILIRKSERKRPLGRCRRKWEDNIKINVNETGCEILGWIELTQHKV
jgi:hypothetical protein